LHIIYLKADYNTFQIDSESEQELKDLYGNVGYTIIDDVLSLPERLPSILFQAAFNFSANAEVKAGLSSIFIVIALFSADSHFRQIGVTLD
jgi:hypothetical protein